jgi:hypothetical protein
MSSSDRALSRAQAPAVRLARALWRMQVDVAPILLGCEMFMLIGCF